MTLNIDPPPANGMMAIADGPNLHANYIRNLRLQKFQATFATRREAGAAASEALRFTFNGTDQDNFDSVTLYHANTATAPSGAKVVDGSDLTSVTGTGTAANVPATTASDVLWYRVQFDGTTLTAKAVKSSTTPTETTWSSTGTCYGSTSFRTTGGMLGFTRDTGSGYLSVDELTVKSYNPATSAFDMTEHYDPFTVDSNGYASDTLTYDNNGNLTYDGSQAYTYDAWNRLMTVSHAYRDASNNLQHGHAVDTMAYDAKGRRVTKAVTGTGSWDCTYHDYYSSQWQLLEERNGSNQPVRQNVWGRTYVDELIQTTASSDPTSGPTTLDKPYYAMQDANWNVLGVVTAAGVLQERYEYTPYGMRTCFFSPGSNDVGCYAPILASRRLTTASGTQQPWDVCENGHQGLECGELTPANRKRVLSVNIGAFLQREPSAALYVDGTNLHLYNHANSVNYIDPDGRDGVGTGIPHGSLQPTPDGPGGGTPFFPPSGPNLPDTSANELQEAEEEAGIFEAQDAWWGPHYQCSEQAAALAAWLSSHLGGPTGDMRFWLISITGGSTLLANHNVVELIPINGNPMGPVTLDTFHGPQNVWQFWSDRCRCESLSAFQHQYPNPVRQGH